MFVSVICPVYNASEYVTHLVDALANQSSEDATYEILVVDNGSTDGTVQFLRIYPVTVLCRTDIQSSYAARNLGIEHARGDVIAFIDADCTPQSDWLQTGVKALQIDPNVDLVAGKVSFRVPRKLPTWHVYDSLNNMDNELSVSRGHAKTANLFVRRRVFDEIGLFPEDVVSGGDVEWTSHAVRAGHRLRYCDDAVVEHPTRGGRQTLIKAFRVGRGFFGRKKSMKYAFLDGSLAFLAVAFKPVLPVVPLSLRTRMRRKGYRSLWLYAKLCFVSHVVRTASSLGLIYQAYIRLHFSKATRESISTLSTDAGEQS